MNTVKPPLRWVGGKFRQKQITDRVKELYQPYRATHIWEEPFVGGLGMTLQVLPEKAFLYDGNEALISFYQLLQAGCIYDYDWVKDIPYTELRDYFNNRLLDDKTFSPNEFLSAFLALNQTCFNGLWRVNAKGFYNVPQGKNSRGEPLTPQEVDLDPLRKVFSTSDWAFQFRVFGNHKLYQGTHLSFFYSDPPYVSTFSGYTESGWTDQNLYSLISRLEETKAPCVLSEKYSEPLENYLTNRGWIVETFSAKRSVSCNGDRTKAKEILAHINCKK
jgi:DNA adenine methylase